MFRPDLVPTFTKQTYGVFDDDLFFEMQRDCLQSFGQKLLIYIVTNNGNNGRIWALLFLESAEPSHGYFKIPINN